MAAPFASLGIAVAQLTFSIGKTLVLGFVAAGDAAVAFESKAAAAMATAQSALGLGAKMGLTGLVAHEALSVVDPNDAIGSWIDRNIPGAGAADDWVSRHLGFGRSYEKQGRAEERRAGTRPLEPGKQSEYASKLADAFTGMGMTREGAAALIGSGIQESGLNPQAGAGTAHQGTWQWDRDRQAAIEQHFRKTLMNMSPTEQAAAAGWEIDNNPRFASLSATLRSSHDLPALNSAVTRQFEAPGNYDTEVPNRLALSRGALAAMAPAAPLPSASGASVAGAPGASGRVDMNVRVTGDTPAVVTSKTSGDVDLYVAQPGMLFAQ